MTKIMKFIGFTILIGLVGCAQGPETSKLKVSIAAVTGSAQFPGGLYLMGKHESGNKFIRVVRETDSIELELENGKWDFASMGWDSTAQHFEGNSFCGLQQGMELKGSDIALDLKATKENCNNIIFGSQVSNNNFYELQFHTCGDIQDHILKGSTIPSNLECGPTNSDEMFSGGLKSFKISLKEVREDGSIKDGLSSRCINDSDGDAKELSEIRLPHGSPFVQLPYEVKGYSAVGCNDGDIQTSYKFLNGFVDPAGEGLGVDLPDGSSSILNVYLHSDICSTAQIDDSSFPAESSDTFLVCSPAQFELIGQSPSNNMSTFVLGKDIEFIGGNTTISGTFLGKVEGNGYTVSGGKNPLFDVLSAPSAGEVIIEDLNIKDFNIEISDTTAGFYGNGFGILANHVKSTGIGKKVRINDINIINSNIEITDAVIEVDTFLGGLVGFIDNTNGGSEEEIEIRNVNSQAHVDGSQSNKVRTGGVVGESKSDADSGSIRFEYNQVGVADGKDLEDTSKRVLVQGHTNVGGFLGKFEYTSIREGNKVIVEVQGDTNIGGIAGDARHNTEVSDSYVDSIFKHPTGTDGQSTNVGGVIGAIAGDFQVNITGVVSKFTIPVPTTTSDRVNKMGGILGGYNYAIVGSQNKEIKIYNTSVFLDVAVNGSDHGGVIGAFSNAVITPQGSPVISHSVVQGVMTVANEQSFNKPKGGFAGYMQKGKVLKSISNMKLIQGDSQLAGGIGEGVSDGIDEAYIRSQIIASNSTAANIKSGGIVGDHNLGSNKYNNIIVDTNIQTSAVVDVSTSSLLFGTSGVDSMEFSGIIALGSVKDSNSFDVTNICTSGAYCNDGVHIQNIYNTDVSCGSLSIDYFNTNFGLCRLDFEAQWDKYGSKSTLDPYYTSFYKAGGLIEPFTITDEASWNGISDNEFLMDKFFTLTQPLDFSGGVYNPIGSLTNPFKGGIIPNWKTISNIIYVAQSNTPGFFPKTDGAKIGVSADPLNLIKPSLQCGAHSNCGPIGTAKNTDLRMIIGDGNIVGASDNIGGLIGFSAGRNYISQSGFEGIINVTGNYIGGLIGQHNVSGETLTIEESYVKARKLVGNDYIGGFLGQLFGSGADLKISNSYAIIDYKDEFGNYDFGSVFSGEIAGIVGGSGGAGIISTDTVYVDTRNSDDGGFVDSIAGTSSVGATNINETFIIHSGPYTYADTFAGPTGSTTHSKELDTSVFKQRDSHDDWAMDGEILKLAWEVYGFKD
jgi:hypothetical protein